MANEREKLCNELIKQCEADNVPVFIAIEKTGKMEYKTVTPEEVSRPESREYNNLLRAVSGFDREKYE